MMNRNPEIIKETITYFAAAGILSVAALFVSPPTALFVVAAGIVFTGLHYFFSVKRYRKIRELSDSLNRILIGQENMLIDHFEEGELSILYSEIHKMTVRLKDQTELLLADKKSLTKAIEDIFHQLRTPLTTMNLTISLLGDEGISYEKRMHLTRDLRRQTEKIAWLVDSLLKMSKIDSESAVFKSETVRVSELVRQAASPFLVQMDLKDISFSMDIREERFTGDLLWSVEAIGNLLKNAVEHTPSGGKIAVAANETALFTEIVVSDNGEGFHAEDIPYLFDRFYKGKNASQGSIGIGLSLSRAIIKAQNGTIAAGNNENGGAEFIVKFYKTVI